MHDAPDWVWIALALGIGCVAVLAGVFFMMVFRPWYRAARHGTLITFPTILVMRLRGYPISIFVDACIELKQAGVQVTIAELATSYSQHKDRIVTSADLADLVRNERGSGNC